MTRACGSCSLCCKVLGIVALDKPAGRWCPHCAVGQGCGVYADRPQECADFNCAWLADERLGPEWKPDRAKFVLVGSNTRNRVVAHVDPAAPAAWRRAPYYEELQKMMRAALPHGGQVFVAVGARVGILLPDGLHELGVLEDDDMIELAVVKRATGDEYKATVRKI